MKFISIEKLNTLIEALQGNPLIYDGDSTVYALDLVITLAEEMGDELTFTDGGVFINEN